MSEDDVTAVLPPEERHGPRRCRECGEDLETVRGAPPVDGDEAEARYSDQCVRGTVLRWSFCATLGRLVLFRSWRKVPLYRQGL